ncbi:unnamed protein product [Penicillium pancosmium]
MAVFNVFRVIADVAHLASVCVLVWAIHRNKSAEGVSLLTQLLYALVFFTRYLDLFSSYSWSFSYYGAGVLWNTPFKLVFLASSSYLIFLMMRVYPRTRERERAWKLGIWSVIGSVVIAPIAIAITYKGFPSFWLSELFWAFSIVLESVCVLPQLLLLRQTTVPTVIDSYYLACLGSYRALYILNWMVRGFGSEKHWDPIALIFGIIQTAFYVDFAWVYYSRQRVKLRNGGVVDSDDYNKSWIVNRVVNFRARRTSTDEEQYLREEETEGDGQPNTNRWGARGISVAADDTLENHGHDHNDGLEGFSDEDDLVPDARQSR